jgi:sugar phosphate isomerase/epimerase
MHNHSRIVANEFAKPEDFLAAMNGMSKYICINLDIGHFVAANFDPVEFLGKWYPRIVTMHIKDRRKNQGENVEFGKGDTPIKDVLLWLKTNKISIPANIEYEYKAPDTVAEIRKCLEYCRSVVA